MNWSTTAQIAVLVFAYIGGIASICHYMGSTLGSRIDDLRFQMSREHDALAKKVDNIGEKLDRHIENTSIHTTQNTP
jgi:uncharacterized membrane protein